MKPSIRIAALTLVILMALTAFAGCAKPAAAPAAGGEAAPAAGGEAAPAAAPAAADGEVMTIIFSTNDAENNLQVTDIYKPYFAKIEELSGGTVKFELHYNAELVNVPEVMDAVANGIIDCGFVRASTMGFPYDSIVECSYPSNNCNRMSRVYNELYDEFPEMQANYENVQLMFLYTMSHAFLATTGKEITKPEECKGLMFIVSNTLQGKSTEALGASPVSCPPTEFYSTLEKGVADGSLAPVTSSMIGDSWYEVCRYAYDMSSTVTTASIVMNKDTFAKLPQACQDYIIESRFDMADFIDELYYKYDQNAIQLLQTDEYGVKIVTPTAEELVLWNEALGGVLPTYAAEMDAAGQPGSTFLAKYMELTEKYAADEYQWK